MQVELISNDRHPVGLALFESGGKPISECDPETIAKVQSTGT